MAAKLEIGRELAAVNQRNHAFYDNLTDEEKKAFAPFILMRYVANPQTDAETYEFVLERVNDLVNKDHWTLSKKHKALLWKLTASCGVGVNLKFTYLKANSKAKVNKIEKLLCDIDPAKKLDEIKLQASLMTKQDIEELFDSLGFDKKQRKEYE